MAGIPADQIERFLVAERVRSDATDCPVRFEVWQEFALRGSQATPEVLLERATDREGPTDEVASPTATRAGPNAHRIAEEIRRRLAGVGPKETQIGSRNSPPAWLVPADGPP